MSKGSRQNGFVPLVERLALVITQAGLVLKRSADFMEGGGPSQGGKSLEVGSGSCR